MADLIVCHAGAKPTDSHLASKAHCIDDEIIEGLERGEQRRPDKAASAANKQPGAGSY